MNLARCLGSQPQSQLRGLAQQYGVRPPAGEAVDSADLPELLAAHLKKEETLRAILEQLDESERAALKVITFAGGGSGVVMEQCHQRINQLTGRRRRNGAQVVAGLIGRGLVYVGRANYRQHYYMPSDLQGQMALLFGQELLNRVASRHLEEVVTQTHDSYAVIRWICQFLAQIRKEDIELTQSGAIYRRAQRQLLRMMGREGDGSDVQGELDDEVSRARENAATGLHPDPLDFVFDYCRSRDLCTIDDSILTATGKAAEWMRLPLNERRRDLLAFWREARVSWDVDVQAVLSVLLTLPGGAWVDLRALFREVEPMASDLFRGSLRRRLEHKVVRYLILQGLLEIGETSQGPVCRLSGLGRSLLTGAETTDDVTPEDQFFVQPNFELLVPSRIDTAVLWRLEEIADLEKPDWMMAYRVTRQSVYRALRLGRRASDIIRLLEEHSRNDLPQNVAFSVSDWASAYGRIKFAAAFTMQCDSSTLADELMASRSVREFILGRLSPTVLIVDRERFDDLLQALETEGYMPSTGIITLRTENPWGVPWTMIEPIEFGPLSLGVAITETAEDIPPRSRRRSGR